MINVLGSCENCIHNDVCKQYDILNELYSFLSKTPYDGVYLDDYLEAHKIDLDLNCAYYSNPNQQSRPKYFEERVL